MQDIDGLFGKYAIRNGVPYYPMTAEELAVAKDKNELEKKKKEKVAPVTWEDLAAIGSQAAASKQLPVEASNIYLVCCSCQQSAEGINNTLLEDYKGNVAVLRAPTLLDLIGPTWQSFPLFHEVHARSIAVSLLAPCTDWYCYVCSCTSSSSNSSSRRSKSCNTSTRKSSNELVVLFNIKSKLLHYRPLSELSV